MENKRENNNRISRMLIFLSPKEVRTNKQFEYIRWKTRKSGDLEKFNMTVRNYHRGISKVTHDFLYYDFNFVKTNMHLNIWSIYDICQFSSLENIIQNSDFPWNFTYISLNRNITIDFVKNNLDKKWDWYILSCNNAFTLQDFLNNKQLPWDKNALTKNLNIPWRFMIEKYPKEADWHTLSKKADLKYIEDNLNLKWRWGAISYRKDLTLDFMEKTINLLGLTSLSRNFKLDFRIVLKYPEKKWDWRALTLYRDTETVEKNLNLPWDWDNMCEIKGFTYEFYERHKAKSLRDFKGDFSKKAKTIEDVKFLISKDLFNPFSLRNTKLVVEICKEFPEYINSFDWFNMTSQDETEMIHVKEGLNLPWCKTTLFYNKNMSKEFLEEMSKKKPNLNNIDVDRLGQSQTLFDKNIYLKWINRDIEKRRSYIDAHLKNVFGYNLTTYIQFYTSYK